MGNRAVIKTKDSKVGVYLHWNGGRDSIEPFLYFCKMKGYRTPETDSYSWARLCQVIGNFLSGTNSLGIDVIEHLDQDNMDNGVYIIKDWKIVGREHFDDKEQDEYDFFEMIESINDRQPKKERLTKKELKAVKKEKGDEK